MNRFNRRGGVVKDTRRYVDHGHAYEEGMRLRPPRRSSPARIAYKARRYERRHPKG